MDKDESSYKDTVKSTAVFGGAQVVQMLITIFKAKFIAVVLGSHGMGANAIFQSTFAIISSLSSFGIFQSAVRDISQANESGDGKALSKINKLFVRMSWCAGILGLLFCLLLSSWMSKIAFENYDFKWHFALLSVALLFAALSNSKTAFLQGTRNVTYLAKSTLVGGLLGLLVSLPALYYFGLYGIVVSIIITPLFLYLSQVYFSRSIKLEKADDLSLKNTIADAKPIAKLGTILMLGMVTMTGFSYLTNILIGRFGQIEHVGLYQGVSSISVQSIAIVFYVLASDFFPKLSAVYNDNKKVNVMVNQQTELVLLIIGPIVIVLVIFAHIIVKLLLSDEFLVMVPVLRLMSLALIGRGIWVVMSYVILAKGDKKAYFFYDCLLGNGLLFVFNIIAYYYWGLNGLGISMLLGSMVVSIILISVVTIKYGFHFHKETKKIIFFIFIIMITCYGFTQLFEGWLQYICSAFSFIIMFFYSFSVLNKRIQITKFLKNKFGFKS